MVTDEKQQPLVSVVVLTFNSARFVLDTLESVRRQTYRQVELIISDDCSSDATVSLVRAWVENHKSRFVRTQIITVQANTGISANANRGFRAAQGEWIKGIAGDDVLMDDCISGYVDFCSSICDKSPVFIVGGLVPFTDGTPPSLETPAAQAIERAPDCYFFVGDLVLKDLCAASPTWFLKRSFWLEMEGFSEKYPFLEDEPFLFRALTGGVRINVLKRNTVFYRIHANSICRSKKPEGLYKFAYSKYHSYRDLRRAYLPSNLRYEYDLMYLRFAFLVLTKGHAHVLADTLSKCVYLFLPSWWRYKIRGVIQKYMACAC